MHKLLSLGAVVGIAAACYRLYRNVANRENIKQNRDDVSKEEVIDTRTQQKFEEILALMTQKFGEVSHRFENGAYCIETRKNEGGNAISVYIGDEITLRFADWHSHYTLDDPCNSFELLEIDLDCDLTLGHALEGFRTNQLCAACSYDVRDPNNVWCGSELMRADAVEDAFIYEEFGANKLVKCLFWDDSKSREFIHIGKMYALTSDPFYQVRKRYPGCSLDYCLIKSCEVFHRGEKSHKAALDFVMRRLSRSEKWLTYDLDKAEAKAIDSAEWLDNHYGDISNNGGRIPYVYAFLKPPRGNCVATGKKQGKQRYRDANVDDFAAINAALFPEGTDELEVFEWTTDWSNYFDDGHEWWGANCWSVYDHRMKRYVVIFASDTD